MVLSLSWHSRSLAADRLGETRGQPTGSLAGVAADGLVFSGAVGSSTGLPALFSTIVASSTVVLFVSGLSPLILLAAPSK